MNAIRPITREHHGTKSWKGTSNYQFTAHQVIAPLAGAEVAKAALTFPLSFIEVAGTWSMAAVLGLAPGQNLFLGFNGQWLTSYIPAAFRAYPFQLARNQNGQYTLCVDEASGLVVDGSEGTPFFDGTGSPSNPIRQILNFLMQIAKSSEMLSRACAALVQQGVIEAWPLTVQDGERQRQIAGLHRINETALNSLSAESFLTLRQVGSLPVAYAQLLSMGNLPVLGKLAQAQPQAQAAAAQTLDLDQTFGLADSSTVDWNSVKWDE